MNGPGGETDPIVQYRMVKKKPKLCPFFDSLCTQAFDSVFTSNSVANTANGTEVAGLVSVGGIQLKELKVLDLVWYDTSGTSAQSSCSSNTTVDFPLDTK